MKSRAFGITALAIAGAAFAFLAGGASGQQAGANPQSAPKRPAASPTTSFREDVLPILQMRCAECHQPGGAGFEKSGLDLRSYAGVMKGTKYGPMVVPRDPDSSNLLVLLDWRAAPELRMPHQGKRIPQEERVQIRRWIMEGARDN